MERNVGQMKWSQKTWCRGEDLNLHALWALAPKASVSAISPPRHIFSKPGKYRNIIANKLKKSATDIQNITKIYLTS